MGLPAFDNTPMIAPDRLQDISAPLEAHWLGTIPYQEAYEIQRARHAQRIAEMIPDQLLLLDHPTVFTVSRRSQPENIRVSKTFLDLKGAQLVPTDRGGEVTMHNPGQLIGYLIRRLDPQKIGLHAYLRSIEESLQRVAAAFGIMTQTRKGLTGVWVEDRKLASIGIAVKKWVTLHGFGLNVSNDLTPFSWIVPCGLAGVRMTSLEAEVGQKLDWEEVLQETCKAFNTVPGDCGFPPSRE
jgi:lipoate-protein ligase B